ncbi:hypothetical protein Q9Q95_03545 [Sphingomonas sp. DG1-23]|jgi:hypothetical protein|uniref:hypothetical protein n=1 Tax=Sphingomonas sp. DG1-23 TaxID=3068316 RepID=UPI00273F9902|nr:hypothetical protein [Sphingomonas sp. DG1-23]MDP5277986.1 hypothetical protein [Sphingomonas sp. DG1-23]
MSEFEFFFTLFGLLLGLTLAEIALKFTDAIAARDSVKLGVLTPMLAIFVLLDLASYWMWTWSVRELIHIDWPTMFAALVVALAYFFAAASVFPRREGVWPALDDYYFKQKRLVVTGVVLANLPGLLLQLSILLPGWNDLWFFVWQGMYWTPLLLLLFIRSRRANILLLAFLLLQYLLVATNALPNSQWGNSVGLNGEAARAASTKAVGAPR